MGCGCGAAVLVTIFWLLAATYYVNGEFPAAMGEALALGLFPGCGIFLLSFVVASGLARTRGRLVAGAAATFLPSLMVFCVFCGFDRDAWQYAVGTFPGALAGALVAFWPRRNHKQQRTAD